MRTAAPGRVAKCCRPPDPRFRGLPCRDGLRLSCCATTAARAAQCLRGMRKLRSRGRDYALTAAMPGACCRRGAIVRRCLYGSLDLSPADGWWKPG
jgi:hypothetical protein